MWSEIFVAHSASLREGRLRFRPKSAGVYRQPPEDFLWEFAALAGAREPVITKFADTWGPLAGGSGPLEEPLSQWRARADLVQSVFAGGGLRVALREALASWLTEQPTRVGLIDAGETTFSLGLESTGLGSELALAAARELVGVRFKACSFCGLPYAVSNENRKLCAACQEQRTAVSSHRQALRRARMAQQKEQSGG